MRMLIRAQLTCLERVHTIILTQTVFFLYACLIETFIFADVYTVVAPTQSQRPGEKLILSTKLLYTLLYM